MSLNLNKREAATVLAALRLFQQHPDTVRDYFTDHFADQKPLSLKQINDLCERVNLDPSHDTVRFGKHRISESEAYTRIVDKIPKAMFARITKSIEADLK